MRALIIDDEEYVRELLADILDISHIECITAQNCKEGLDLLLKGEQVDFVFVDWRTPLMSGLEFAKTVRGDAKIKNVPLLMVTGKTDMEDVQEALKVGVNEYLMKPFTPDMVKNKLALLGFDVG